MRASRRQRRGEGLQRGKVLEAANSLTGGAKQRMDRRGAMGLGHQQVQEVVGHGVEILWSWRSCTYRHEEGLAGFVREKCRRRARLGCCK